MHIGASGNKKWLTSLTVVKIMRVDAKSFANCTLAQEGIKMIDISFVIQMKSCTFLMFLWQHFQHTKSWSMKSKSFISVNKNLKVVRSRLTKFKKKMLNSVR